MPHTCADAPCSATESTWIARMCPTRRARCAAPAGSLAPEVAAATCSAICDLAAPRCISASPCHETIYFNGITCAQGTSTRLRGRQLAHAGGGDAPGGAVACAKALQLHRLCSGTTRVLPYHSPCYNASSRRNARGPRTRGRVFSRRAPSPTPLLSRGEVLNRLSPHT